MFESTAVLSYRNPIFTLIHVIYLRYDLHCGYCVRFKIYYSLSGWIDFGAKFSLYHSPLSVLQILCTIHSKIFPGEKWFVYLHFNIPSG